MHVSNDTNHMVVLCRTHEWLAIDSNVQKYIKIGAIVR